MSRPLRILYPDAWYHVMNRGRRKERIFLNDDDFCTFISLLKEPMELWSIHVAGYSLMTNHYHLLLQTPEANLPRCMRHVDGVYTQRFNWKYNHDGSLFRGRYKSILIVAEGYIAEVLRYLHKNPLKAGLEDRIGKYKWTSHTGYLSRARKWSWLRKKTDQTNRKRASLSTLMKKPPFLGAFFMGGKHRDSERRTAPVTWYTLCELDGRQPGSVQIENAVTVTASLGEGSSINVETTDLSSPRLVSRVRPRVPARGGGGKTFPCDSRSPRGMGTDEGFAWMGIRSPGSFPDRPVPPSPVR
ncbi:MAG: transposase [Planctomycetota bacterium]